MTPPDGLPSREEIAKIVCGREHPPIDACRKGFVAADEILARLRPAWEGQTKVGVTAVIRDADGRILLGRKGRAFDPSFSGKWVTPGGRVQYGEPLETAVVREVLEETGLVVGVHRALPPQELIHENGHYVFFAFEAEPIHGTLCSGDDLTEVRWCDAAELKALREQMTDVTRELIDAARARPGVQQARKGEGA